VRFAKSSAFSGAIGRLGLAATFDVLEYARPLHPFSLQPLARSSMVGSAFSPRARLGVRSF
jgi:hypothetical protein